DNSRTTPQITEFSQRRTSTDNQRMISPSPTAGLFSKRSFVNNNQKSITPTTEFSSRRTSTDNQKPVSALSELFSRKVTLPAKSPARRTSSDDQKSISIITSEISSKEAFVDNQKSTSPMTNSPTRRTPTD